jgi:hypothetical protein
MDGSSVCPLLPFIEQSKRMDVRGNNMAALINASECLIQARPVIDLIVKSKKLRMPNERFVNLQSLRQISI